jgi:hypothetical protein
MASVDVPADVALVASYGDLTRARRNHRRIVLMQHGIGQSYGDRNPAYPGGRDNDAVGLFLVPGDQPAARWRAAYPKARVEVVGTPLLDDLPRRSPDGQTTIAVTFHWLKGASEHFRDAVVALADQFHVIGHGHPRASRLPRFWAKHGIEHVPDFMDVCRRADLLLFDNTSAGYLFAATGRPVVVMNGPDYRREWDYGLRFWDAADVGVQVSGDLYPAVCRALEEWPEDVAKREAALDMVFAYRTGAAERASDTIREWAA